MSAFNHKSSGSGLINSNQYHTSSTSSSKALRPGSSSSRRGRLRVAVALLVGAAFLSTAAHLAASASAARHKQADDGLRQQLDSVKREVKDALGDVSRGLYKEISKAGAGWVRDADVQHVIYRDRSGGTCDGLNSSSSSSTPRQGLQLDVSAGSGLVAPVVVLAHARGHYLAKTMLTLYRHWSADPANAARFPLFISVDGSHQPTLMLATSLTFAAGLQVIRVQRDTAKPPCSPPWDSYCNLALHYKALLQLFFQCLNAPRLIFIEEDLQVAPDFFSYMHAAAPLLTDPSIWCVSAWNDHGQAGRAANTTALYRTDVFPGLGWMLTRSVGLELMPTWPAGYWDDNHMRKPHVHKGRQCVFPEVPRTHTFGAVGASNSMYYREHLANMVLNADSIDWAKQDLSYLTADRYAALMRHWLSRAQPINTILQQQDSRLRDYCNATQPAAASSSGDSDLYLRYQGNADFERLGRELAPMLADVSGGAQIPRGVYNSTGHGVVIVRCRQRRLFLVSREPAAGAAG